MPGAARAVNRARRAVQAVVAGARAIKALPEQMALAVAVAGLTLMQTALVPRAARAYSYAEYLRATAQYFRRAAL